MERNAASFNRQKSRYKPQPTVLVICEDSKSGKRYLEDASRHFRVNVVVEITHCGKTDPFMHNGRTQYQIPQPVVSILFVHFLGAKLLRFDHNHPVF